MPFDLTSKDDRLLMPRAKPIMSSKGHLVLLQSKWFGIGIKARVPMNFDALKGERGKRVIAARCLLRSAVRQVA